MKPTTPPPGPADASIRRAAAPVIDIQQISCQLSIYLALPRLQNLIKIDEVIVPPREPLLSCTSASFLSHY